MAKNKETRKS